MESDFRSLANSYISHLTVYQPGKPIAELERELGISAAIKLASNENALGPSPKAISAAQNALLHSHMYPDGGCFNLRQSLAQFLNVAPEQLTFGNGSENILEMIAKSYLSPGDNAIVSQYAFITISLLIKGYGAEILEVPAKNFGHDVKKMLAAINQKTRIIFIVNPNNPTGTYINHDELKYLLESIPPHILVVIDEAYYEYIDQPNYPHTLQLLPQYPNLIMTRTFSKLYGLASLRIGYSISSTQIAEILNRARLPFNVNTIAATAAEAALLDLDHMAQTLMMNKRGRNQLTEELKKLKINYIPSLGNFMTIDVKSNAATFYQKLLYKGVIVRPLAAYDMSSHIRVTIGTTEQNERFLQALNSCMKE